MFKMIDQTFEFEVIKVNSHGEIIQRSRHQNTYFSEDLGEGVILEMVSIPGGTLILGLGTRNQEIKQVSG